MTQSRSALSRLRNWISGPPADEEPDARLQVVNLTRNTILASSVEVADSGPDPEEQYRRREREQIVTAAIDGLKPKARSVVEVHQIQERSLKETAQVLGISAAAAKARMFHARAALRRMPLLKNMGGSNWATAG